MDWSIIRFALVASSLFLFTHNEVEGYNILSDEEDLKLEEELKRLNKPSVKTIHTKYGNVYDCVDFYQQSAFDHPLLKNHNFHPKMKPTFAPERLPSNNSTLKIPYKSMKLDDGGCPFGTVPIRRTTKDDLITSKIYSDARINAAEPLGTHHAIARTKTPGPYFGAVGEFNAFNLPVNRSQYTSSQLKLINDDESITVGWTVNPGVYGGDNHTRMFIYVDAKINCFNTQCGFVQVNQDIPVDQVVAPASTYGGNLYGDTFLIQQDPANKNWFLQIGLNYTVVGFWPASIFAKMGEGATRVEWGGESFSPPGVPAPGMGSGHRMVNSDLYDGFARQINVLRDKFVDPGPLETFTDNEEYYFAADAGVRKEVGHIILYGGPRGLIV